MKDPKDWNEQYILQLPVGEFDWLEAKGRRSIDLTCNGVDENDVRQTLSKAISAFANSGGGTLVFGLANPINIWRVDDGGVSTTIKRPSTREWLEDIIPNVVDPPLRKFNVYAISRSSPTSQIVDGRAIFAIHVPDSEQAPHQATDNRYYGRVAGKSRPLSHRFVLDILSRRRHPIMSIQCSIESERYTPRSPIPEVHVFAVEKREKITRVVLAFTAQNVGLVMARYVTCRIHLPYELLDPDGQREYIEKVSLIDNLKYVQWAKRNEERDVLKHGMFGPEQWGTTWFDPVLPGLSYSWEWPIRPDFNKDQFNDRKIYWSAFADNAPVQSGEILVSNVSFSHVEKD